jgi:hypothetical protein
LLQPQLALEKTLEVVFFDLWKDRPLLVAKQFSSNPENWQKAEH